MSADPIRNTTSFQLQGDIGTGKGQLGYTTQVISTATPIINQAPGTFFSNYYTHYLFNISPGANADFNLAEIGTGVSVGYTAEVDCLIDPTNTITNTLTIKSNNGTVIAVLYPGSKVFLTAVGATDNWKTAYAVPEGRDNWLIVYTDKYPQVRLLPIQKEFYYNANFEYGIKCLQSFDYDEASLITNLTGYDNLNRIIFEGSSMTSTQNLQLINQPVINSYISCDNCTYVASQGLGISSMIASYNQAGFEQIGDSKGLFIAGCNGSTIDNSLGAFPINCAGFIHSTDAFINGADGNTKNNISVIASNTVNITTVSTLTPMANVLVAASNAAGIDTSRQAMVIASNGSGITNSESSSVMSSFASGPLSTIATSIISSDTCNLAIQGDGVFTRNATGYLNTRAGISLLSSYNVSQIVTASDLRYCVIGGYNTPTWSIDSKTGQFYGLGNFNPGTALPGFAEMYENLVQEVIPYGRLLQLENGKVRLAQNGESGFMISRPYESAAFVAGNPKLSWPGKFELDEYGLPVMYDYKRDEYIEAMKLIGCYSKELQADIDETFSKSETFTYKKVNSKYDISQPYVPRSERRDQWTTCEKSGIVTVEYTGELAIGNYVISGRDGVAKRSSRKTNIQVVDIDLDASKSVSKSVAKVDIANQNIASYVDDVVCKIVKDSQAIVSALPVDISIKDIVFANDSFAVAAESRIKICISMVGDFLLASDVSVAIVGKNGSYDLLTNYSKLRSQYVINSVFKGVVKPDTYQIVFTTSKTLPSECKLSAKV